MPDKISIIPAQELDQALIKRWVELRDSNPGLANPFFHPEFTRVIAGVRNDVEVAIIEDASGIVGFLPFQREGRKAGRPVGHPLSDYHGVICGPNTEVNLISLLRACQLSSWDFDHVPTSQTFFRPFFRFTEISPTIDLRVGFDRYLAEQKARGSRLQKPLQLMRKLEREVGPLRLEPHVPQIDALEFVLTKKSEQFGRTDQVDLFANPWVRRAVESVFETKTPDFSGTLSVLYAGPERVAALLAICSRKIWHAWFMAFEDRFASYSPGLLLYLKIVEHGAALGFECLDFGKGDHAHKKRMMDGFVSVGTGSLALSSVRLARTLKREITGVARGLVLKSPLAEIGRHWVRKRRSQRWRAG